MTSNEVQFQQVAQDLRSSIADLNRVNPWIGLFRFWSLGLVCLGFIALAWRSQSIWEFIGYSAIAGFVYAIWFICTHDATHHTLTGWHWFDDVFPRFISYPMLWMHGVYVQLHRLHHGWNGMNIQDPERVQWTIEEYQTAPTWMRWYVRHQWDIDLFLLGGFGMIGKTILKGWQFGEQFPVIRRAFWWDAIGILAVQTGLVTFAIFSHQVLRYILFWLILERVIGAVMQARDHLEHYGMWSKAPNYQLTQLYSSRNLAVHPIVGWFVGGLNYHSIHHAFPNLAFDQLPEAFSRINLVLERHQLPPMTIGSGYFREWQRLRGTLSLIAPNNCPHSQT